MRSCEKAPASDEVQVWAVSLDTVPQCDVQKSFRGLNESEQRRAESYRRELDRDRYIVQRSSLRRLLGTYLNCAPQDVPLCAASNGKPILGNHHPLHFSVTRSEGLGLLAFTTAGPIGVDFELVREFPERWDVVRNYYSSAEQSALNGLPVEEQLAGFFEAWTLKEAMLKATGEGVGALATAEVRWSEESKPFPPPQDRHGTSIWFHTLNPAPNWTGHVVVIGSKLISNLKLGSLGH